MSSVETDILEDFREEECDTQCRDEIFCVLLQYVKEHIYMQGLKVTFLGVLGMALMVKIFTVFQSQ